MKLTLPVYLSYHTSASSALTPVALITNIIKQVEKRGYKVEKVSKSKLWFKNATLLRSKASMFYIVDKGMFEITMLNDHTLVKYTWSISILPEVIVTILLAICMFFVSPAMVIVALGWPVVLCLQVYLLKGAADKLLKLITV